MSPSEKHQEELVGQLSELVSHEALETNLEYQYVDHIPLIEEANSCQQSAQNINDFSDNCGQKYLTSDEPVKEYEIQVEQNVGRAPSKGHDWHHLCYIESQHFGSNSKALGTHSEGLVDLEKYKHDRSPKVEQSFKNHSDSKYKVDHALGSGLDNEEEYEELYLADSERFDSEFQIRSKAEELLEGESDESESSVSYEGADNIEDENFNFDDFEIKDCSIYHVTPELNKSIHEVAEFYLDLGEDFEQVEFTSTPKNINKQFHFSAGIDQDIINVELALEEHIKAQLEKSEQSGEFKLDASSSGGEESQKSSKRSKTGRKSPKSVLTVHHWHTVTETVKVSEGEGSSDSAYQGDDSGVSVDLQITRSSLTQDDTFELVATIEVSDSESSTSDQFVFVDSSSHKESDIMEHNTQEQHSDQSQIRSVSQSQSSTNSKSQSERSSQGASSQGSSQSDSYEQVSPLTSASTDDEWSYHTVPGQREQGIGEIYQVGDDVVFFEIQEDIQEEPKNVLRMQLQRIDETRYSTIEEVSAEEYSEMSGAEEELWNPSVKILNLPERLQPPTEESESDMDENVTVIDAGKSENRKTVRSMPIPIPVEHVRTKSNSMRRVHTEEQGHDTELAATLKSDVDSYDEFHSNSYVEMSSDGSDEGHIRRIVHAKSKVKGSLLSHDDSVINTSHGSEAGDSARDKENRHDQSEEIIFSPDILEESFEIKETVESCVRKKGETITTTKVIEESHIKTYKTVAERSMSRAQWAGFSVIADSEESTNSDGDVKIEKRPGRRGLVKCFSTSESDPDMRELFETATERIERFDLGEQNMPGFDHIVRQRTTTQRSPYTERIEKFTTCEEDVVTINSNDNDTATERSESFTTGDPGRGYHAAEVNGEEYDMIAELGEYEVIESDALQELDRIDEEDEQAFAQEIAENNQTIKAEQCLQEFKYGTIETSESEDKSDVDHLFQLLANASMERDECAETSAFITETVKIKGQGHIDIPDENQLVDHGWEIINNDIEHQENDITSAQVQHTNVDIQANENEGSKEKKWILSGRESSNIGSDINISRDDISQVGGESCYYADSEFSEDNRAVDINLSNRDLREVDGEETLPVALKECTQPATEHVELFVQRVPIEIQLNSYTLRYYIEIPMVYRSYSDTTDDFDMPLDSRTKIRHVSETMLNITSDGEVEMEDFDEDDTFTRTVSMEYISMVEIEEGQLSKRMEEGFGKTKHTESFSIKRSETQHHIVKKNTRKKKKGQKGPQQKGHQQMVAADGDDYQIVLTEDDWKAQMLHMMKREDSIQKVRKDPGMYPVEGKQEWDFVEESTIVRYHQDIFGPNPYSPNHETSIYQEKIKMYFRLLQEWDFLDQSFIKHWDSWLLEEYIPESIKEMYQELHQLFMRGKQEWDKSDQSGTDINTEYILSQLETENISDDFIEKAKMFFARSKFLPKDEWDLINESDIDKSREHRLPEHEGTFMEQDQKMFRERDEWDLINESDINKSREQRLPEHEGTFTEQDQKMFKERDEWDLINESDPEKRKVLIGQESEGQALSITNRLQEKRLMFQNKQEQVTEKFEAGIQETETEAFEAVCSFMSIEDISSGEEKEHTQVTEEKGEEYTEQKEFTEVDISIGDISFDAPQHESSKLEEEFEGLGELVEETAKSKTEPVTELLEIVDTNKELQTVESKRETLTDLAETIDSKSELEPAEMVATTVSNSAEIVETKTELKTTYIKGETDTELAETIVIQPESKTAETNAETVTELAETMETKPELENIETHGAVESVIDRKLVTVGENLGESGAATISETIIKNVSLDNTATPTKMCPEERVPTFLSPFLYDEGPRQRPNVNRPKTAPKKTTTGISKRKLVEESKSYKKMTETIRNTQSGEDETDKGNDKYFSLRSIDGNGANK